MGTSLEPGFPTAVGSDTKKESLVKVDPGDIESGPSEASTASPRQRAFSWAKSIHYFDCMGSLVAACGIQLPDQGSNLRCLHWEPPNHQEGPWGGE